MANAIAIPIEISARHLHLSEHDLHFLFGDKYELSVLKELSQKGEFASNSTVDIKFGEKIIQHVRIIGPTRDNTQVELSQTDAVFFGITAPVKLSGDINNTPGITIMGPNGSLQISKGVIIAQRHIHASLEEAAKNNLSHGQIIKVKVMGSRRLIFDQVAIRVAQNFSWAMHVDTDEANAAGINKNNNIGELIF